MAAGGTVAILDRPQSGDGNEFAPRFASDFSILACLGLTHHRLSIEWARIEPREGQRDAAAIEHSRAVPSAACDAGLSSWVCVHHFTLPVWFIKIGKDGFHDDHARSCYWARHAAFCAATFGDLIGFSYYSAHAVIRDLTFAPYPTGERVGPGGYVPWSEGLAFVLHRLADELPGRPLLVCEHGVGTDDDGWGREIRASSLGHVAHALADGIDVRGFFHWTAVDNYEWQHGFSILFGILDRDRTPRGLAELLAGYARPKRRK